MTNESHLITGLETNPKPEVADELKQDAGRIKDSVSTRARQEAESRKGQAVHVAGSASTALNTAAQDLRDNPDVPDWMATGLQQAARKIEGLASHVEGRSIDQLGQDVAEFGRRNPGTFLLASAAAGFAAARVLRAGVDKKRHEGGDGQASSYAADDAQTWAADENIMPTEAGDFTPAYSQGDQAFEGTVR